MDNEQKLVRDALQKRFEELPEKVKKLLMGERLPSTIRMIAEKHRLSKEQTAELENEIALILLCFEDQKDLPQTLTREFVIPPHTAENIAKDLGDMLFEDVQDHLESAIAKQIEAEEERGQSAKPDTPDDAPAVPTSTTRKASYQEKVPEESDPEPEIKKQREEESHEDQPFYPRMPDYSKPFTDRTPPQNDPYREPIE